MRLDFKGYSIRNSSDNIILAEKYIREKTNEVKEKDLGYFSNLQQALLAMLRYSISKSEVTTVENLLKVIQESRNEIKELVSEKFKMGN